ncbi:hypothetical protein ACLB2K_074206 [Fragaria x ananassa]
MYTNGSLKHLELQAVVSNFGKRFVTGLHSLDIREGLTRAISPGMIFGDRFALSGERKRANGVVCRYRATQFGLSGERKRTNGVACRYRATQFALSGERKRVNGFACRYWA